MIKKLTQKLHTVDKIFHLADIHIRLFKRQQEYREVFENLYKEIQKEKTDTSIIVVAGDIAHSKTEMSPEAIQLISDFFKNLSDILPTIVTAGNHDANLNNASRLDAISPIINALNHKNLYYLKDTGVYKIGDVLISVMSIFDNIDEYIQAKDIDSDLTKIAIFHGPIYNSMTDSKWKVTSEKVTTNLFNGYDIALLGDIHKYQMLQPYGEVNGIKKPCIAYPSSLVQQNFGESPDKHGMLIWNVASRTYEFRDIKNDYAFITLSVDDGKVVSEIPDIPSKAKIRLLVENSTPSQLKECINGLKSTYKPIEITINKSSSKSGLDESTHKVNLSQIRDVDFQNKLLKDYFERKDYNLDDKTLGKIFEINAYLNSKLPTEEITRNVTWKPKVFKFSNMFSYGEGNIIDFSKMDGIVGLFSSNASGKTSVLESLTFCLFDKCSKTFRAASILNNRKDHFFCELLLEISGEDYVITRSANKTASSNVNVKVDFYKIMPDGTPFSLNGEHRRDTDSVIRSYIGTYEDFILTSVSSQNNTANFIDKSQSERIDLLTAFMDITIFDQLYEMGTNDIKEYQVLVKEYEKNDYEGEIADHVSNIEKYSNEYSVLKLSKDSLTEKKITLNDSILCNVKKLITVDTSIVDINSLEASKKSIESKVLNSQNALSELNSKISNMTDKYKMVSKSVSEYEQLDIVNKYEHLVHMEEKLNSLDSDIDKFKVEVGHKMEKTKRLRELEYDPNCKYCMNNIFVKDAIEAKKELENDKNRAKEISTNRANLVSEISLISKVRGEYEQYNIQQTEMDKLKIELLKSESKKSSLESEITTYKSNLQNVSDKIDKYYKSKQYIEYNKQIEKEISKLKSDMSGLTDEFDVVEDELRETHSKLIFLEEKKRIAIESLEKFKDMEEKYISYQYYLQATHRDSIPYELISEAIPSIEKEVNNILSQVVDFAVMLELDGKNINGKIVYDENKIWPLEMASGMEKFIAGMAIRVALVDITSLPKPPFIAIDEGFSSLDADNSSNLPVFLDYLKTQFSFIFVISHMDYMRDFVDTSLDLKIDDEGYSKISFV